MKSLLSLLFVVLFLSANAQGNKMYGIARKTSPNFAIYMAEMVPSTGVVSNLSTTSLGTIFTLSGAALNPYTNSYYFIGIDSILTVDLNTGLLSNIALITNPIADSYFDNFRFNNSDTLIYGIARRYFQATSTGEIFLSTINTQTGVITQISPTSVGEIFALEGSAIDPYQKVYYYTDGTNLIGLDMYNGSVYSSVPITIPSGGTYFGNFAYSCADTTLYGLIRENLGFGNTEMHLGKINPATGVVTTISPAPISTTVGFSVNAGATIDPSTMTYYYSNVSTLVGLSLTTGMIVSQPSYTHDNNCEYFDLMRIESSCYNAQTALRPDPSANISDLEITNDRLEIVPNPATSSIEIQGEVPIERLEIYNATGQLIKQIDNYTGELIEVSALTTGIYFLKAINENQEISTAKFVKE